MHSIHVLSPVYDSWNLKEAINIEKRMLHVEMYITTHTKPIQEILLKDYCREIILCVSVFERWLLCAPYSKAKKKKSSTH